MEVLPTTAEKINNFVLTSTKLTLGNAPLEYKENEVLENLEGKRQKAEHEFSLGDLVTTADKRTFSGGDTTIRYYRLYAVSEISFHAIRSYKLNKILKRYNEIQLKQSNKTLNDEESLMMNLPVLYVKDYAPIWLYFV